MSLIWIVEDHQKINAHITALLRDEGHQTRSMASAEEAIAAMAAGLAPDLALLDIRLPGKSGLDLIHEWAKGQLPPTIVISGEATISEALESMRLGVHDFVEKPFSDERLVYAVRNCLEKLALRDRIRSLERELGGGQPIVGHSSAVRHMLETIDKLAPTDGRVLITGESGTGKELVAATIHARSRRRGGPFVRINCASFPVHLIEDELFGHVKGAFTDAHQNKMGLFEEANRGTLFLDEIGDMDYSLQARLLRVLEDGVVRRIGAKTETKVDVRVITATNRDLMTMVEEKRFREDLYYRLASIPVEAPPLRDRHGDVPLLLAFYVERFCKQYQMRVKQIAPEVIDLLSAYRWPGNVRELRNLCERMAIFGGDTIGVEVLPSQIWSGGSPEPTNLLRITEMPAMPLRDFKNQCEKEYIEAWLHRTNWNYVKVAELLHTNRSYLHQKITALGIERKKLG